MLYNIYDIMIYIIYIIQYIDIINIISYFIHAYRFVCVCVRARVDVM